MPKQKSHVIELSVTFDKPVSQAVATRAVRNNLVPSELCASIADEEAGGWSTARITSAKRPQTETTT